MNVAEIRQRIFDQMDFSPDLQQYKDSVVRRMNDHYQQLCDSAHWLFMQKEQKIQVRAQIKGTAAGVSFDNTVYIQVMHANKRKVIAPNGSTNNGSTPLINSTVTFTLEMEGQTLIDSNGNEYTIISVESSDTMYIDKTWLKGTSSGLGSSETDFTIRYDRFLLPEDCIEVLSLMDRDDDRGKLAQINSKRAEIMYLDRDTSGEPLASIDDESFLDESPLSSLTLADSTGGNLVSGNKYEYRYTIYRYGRESPPSLVTQHTLGSTATAVTVSGMDDTTWYTTSTTYDSGIIKLIYRRDVTNNGRWMLIETVAAGTTSTADTEIRPTTSNSFKYLASTTFTYSYNQEVKKWQDPGPRQYLRFWFTPSDDRFLHIRFHRRPRPLVSDTDAPEIPRQYHQLLVYMTLEDMYSQMQDLGQAAIFRGRSEQLITQMRRRYLVRDGQRKRFARWDKPRANRLVGVVSSDFEGSNPPY